MDRYGLLTKQLWEEEEEKNATLNVNKPRVRSKIYDTKQHIC